MPVYRPLRDTDVLQTILTAGAMVSVTSGSGGWRGGSAGTGSAGVYDGFRSSGYTGLVRARPVVYPGVTDVGMHSPVSGTYPLTSSMRWVEVRLDDRAEGRLHWGNRSWRPIERLYEHRSRYRPEFDHTSYYDYHCAFFERNSGNAIVVSASYPDYLQFNVSSSFTWEAWIKPFFTGSSGQRYVIMARRGWAEMFISGGAGDLAVTFTPNADARTGTASLKPALGRWNHVAMVWNNSTASFYVNLRYAGQVLSTDASPGTLNDPNKDGDDIFADLSVGALYDDYYQEPPGSSPWYEAIRPSSTGTETFNGAIHEVREWGTARTYTQLSSSHNRRLLGDEVGLVHYLSMRAGHRSGSVLGSSSIDDRVGSTRNVVLVGSSGRLSNWQPCDNPYFYPDKTEIRSAPSYAQRYLRALSVPSLFYGRQIATGTFEMTERQNEFSGTFLHRVIRDDGRGGLYMRLLPSGTREQDLDPPVTWNRVGHIFYPEGIAVLNHDAAIHFADGSNYSFINDPARALSLGFRGVNRIPTNMISCRVGPAEANASNNATYATRASGSDRYELVDPTRTTWITAVGLYDDRYRLVGVAKLAAPLRKRERDRFNIRLKFDR